MREGGREIACVCVSEGEKKRERKVWRDEGSVIRLQ